MKTLRSFVQGEWHEASSGFATLVDPCTEEGIARASSAGVDFGAALAWAREHGGPALREMTFAQRGELLKAMSGVLRDGRDELSRATDDAATARVRGDRGTLCENAAVRWRCPSRARCGARCARLLLGGVATYLCTFYEHKSLGRKGRHARNRGRPSFRHERTPCGLRPERARIVEPNPDRAVLRSRRTFPPVA